MTTPETPEQKQSDLFWRILELALATMEAGTRQNRYHAVIENRPEMFNFYIYSNGGTAIDFDDNLGFPLKGSQGTFYLSRPFLDENEYYLRMVAFIARAIEQLKKL